MSCSSEREPGWYWVRDSQHVWEPAELALTPEAGYAWWYRCAWYTASDDRSADDVLGCEIGSRISKPDESSKVVATGATPRSLAEIVHDALLATVNVVHNGERLRDTLWQPQSEHAAALLERLRAAEDALRTLIAVGTVEDRHYSARLHAAALAQAKAVRGDE